MSESMRERGNIEGTNHPLELATEQPLMCLPVDPTSVCADDVSQRRGTFSKACVGFIETAKFRMALERAARSALRMETPNPRHSQHQTHGLLVHISHNELAEDSSQAFDTHSFSRESLEELSARHNGLIPWMPWIREDLGKQKLISVQVFSSAELECVLPSRFTMESYGIDVIVPTTRSGDWDDDACHMASPCFTDDVRSLIECPNLIALNHLADDEACRSVLRRVAYSTLNLITPEARKSHALVVLLDHDPSAKFNFNLVDAQFQLHSKAIALLRASCMSAYDISLVDYYQCLEPPGKDGRVWYNVVLLEQHRGRFRHVHYLAFAGFQMWKKTDGKSWKDELFDYFNEGDSSPRKEWGQNFGGAVAAVKNNSTALLSARKQTSHATSLAVVAPLTAKICQQHSIPSQTVVELEFSYTLPSNVQAEM
ncbi:hypothetical protein P7C70_g5381, partial [Phenoliferia sp. Uapishka_3]